MGGASQSRTGGGGGLREDGGGGGWDKVGKGVVAGGR